MELNIEKLADEVMQALSEVNVEEDGEHLYTNYQKVVAWTLRLTELHNMLSLAEISGQASPELRKFRTAVLDPTIERLDRVAMYESRKITAKSIEMNLER